MELRYDRLPWLFLTIILVAGILHRGGISIQTHLLWAVGLLPLFLVTQKTYGKSNALPKNSSIFLVILGILVFISWLNSSVKNYGFFGVTGLFAGIGTFFITSRWHFEKQKFWKWTEYLLLFATFLSIFGFILYTRASPDRIFATFAEFPSFLTSYPNAFALFIAALLPFSFHFLFEDENTAWKIINTVLLTALVLTFSRGTWIAVMMVGGLASWIYRKSWNRQKWKTLLTIAIGVTVLTTGIQLVRAKYFPINTIANKVDLSSSEKKTSVDERFEFWTKSFHIMAERPIFGFGPDSFPFAYAKFQDQMLAISGHPHDVFLKIATENGIPALLALLAFLFVIFNNLRKSKEPFAQILMLSLVTILIHNIFDYNLNFTSTNLLFWTFLGWSASIAEEKREVKYATPILIGFLFILAFAGLYEIVERRVVVQGRSLIDSGHTEEGLAKFEVAKPIFRQDLDFIIGETYKSIIEKEGFKKWGVAAIQQIEKSMKRNADAGLKNLAAEIYFLGDNNASKIRAQELVKEALELDSKNWIRYYYNWVRMNGIVPDRKKLEKVLGEYYALLKDNAHNTILTDNPHYAVLLANLLGEKELVKKMTYTGQKERRKLAKDYEIPLPTF